MRTVIYLAVIVVSFAGAARAVENPILVELSQKGVVMAGGAVVKLPAPSMTDEMDAKAQTAAIEKAIGSSGGAERFLEKNSEAPVITRIKTLRGEGDTVYRTVDLWFVAHGKWSILTSDKFGDGVVKGRKEKDESKEKTGQGRMVSKVGFLTKEEMQKRSFAPLGREKEGIEERYFYTTFTLFDRVEISATRHIVLSKTPRGVVVAAKLDPRLAKDAEYPNQWRSVERDAAANVVYGKPQPYQGAGFYVKITRLAEPADAIFVEYHGVFHEPKGWFDGENMLRSKLPLVAKHEVKQFRIKLARACIDAEQATAK